MSNIIDEYNKISHVKWVPCHHGMVRPHIVDGEDSLQTAANILNKESWTAKRGWPSSLGGWVGGGLTTPHHK
jgi:hypothetical protein